MGLPFMGASGQLLNEALAKGGFIREQCYITNVFTLRPPDNDLKHFFSRTPTGGPKHGTLGYLKSEHVPDLERLAATIERVRPNRILALGGTAAWALINELGISKLRGYYALDRFHKRYLVMPSLHPASILRQWSNLPYLISDISKLHQGPPDEIDVYVAENKADIAFIRERILSEAQELSFDVETKDKQITKVSLSFHPKFAYVFSFRPTKWDHSTAVYAWEALRDIMASPIPKVAQNGLYDVQYLFRIYGITPRNFSFDTMLAHHALQPEMPKDLGTLASVFINIPRWKHFSRTEELKLDE